MGATATGEVLKGALPALPALGQLARGLRHAPPADETQRVRGEVRAKALLAAQAAPLGHSQQQEEQQQQQQQGSSAPQLPPLPEFGFERGWASKYRLLRELGRGGNGVVTLVLDLNTGQEYATKSIPKVLTDPNVSDRKKAGHAEAIKREVEVLRRLRGCLNVASLEEVYEDDTHVHLVMQYCRGGELHHRIGDRPYTERTVASFMRAVLRTLAQCHSHKILHRDIKPGNFLLSSNDDLAPLKAIDFGLAVFFEDKQLPRTDLGLEGTPWFMSPESLSSRVYPASDLWAAGVMAHQLLTGRFPFDDRQTPHSPSLSRIWRSILSEEVNVSRTYFDGISPEAKDFVKMLLHKDPLKRPSAREALKHPWLQGPGVEERSQGKPLSLAVVQRIQRFSQASVFKRTVLELIAEELLSTEPEETERAVPIGKNARPIITCPQSSPLEYLYSQLDLAGEKHLVDREAVAEGLAKLGYRLAPDELERLLDQLDTGNTGKVAKSQLAASQIDWRALQQSSQDRWLELVRAAFMELDADGDGVLSIEEIMSSLRHKLPAAEVDSAVAQALQEASRGSESVQVNNIVSGSIRGGLNFHQFCRMLSSGSLDSLDLYDDRLGSLGSYGSLGSLAALDKSCHGSNQFTSPLQTVPEGH